MHLTSRGINHAKRRPLISPVNSDSTTRSDLKGDNHNTSRFKHHTRKTHQHNLSSVGPELN